MPGLQHCGIAMAAAALAFACASSGGAQENSQSLADAGDRLETGKPVTVITTSGHVVKGRLTALSPGSLALFVDGKPQTIASEDVNRIRQRQADSLKNGVLIGAASGAVYALSWFVRDPNECGGSPCGPDFVYSIGLGGLIGLGVDALVKRTVTVDNPAAARRSISPAAGVRPGGGSMSLAVRW